MKLQNIILGMVFLCLPPYISYGQGARYTGSYSKSAAIQHVRKSNFVIEGLDFSNVNGDIIALYDCENVTIRNNRFTSSNKRGIYLYNCKNVTMIDNTFENVHTALVASTSQGVVFEYNDIYNVGGPLALSDDTNNGFVAQFIMVTGAGNSISYNAAENIYGESSPGDLINVNQSHGTAQSPIIVKGNWFRGGGPSPSGGGILIGDLGGSYQIAEENILVNPGQYGMGIGGGHNMILRNNKVFAKRQDHNNVGYSICNWSEDASGKSYGITFEKNIVNYSNRNGESGNSWWIYQNMEPVAGKSTNKYDPTLTASILPEKLIGRARSSSIPDNPNEGSTPLPEENSDPAPEKKPDPVPEKEPGNSNQDKETDNPDNLFPEIKNDPSIMIYQDMLGRICINISGRVLPSATFIAANEKGEIVYQQGLARFHTVLPEKPNPGKYILFVSNGDKAFMKTFVFR